MKNKTEFMVSCIFVIDQIKSYVDYILTFDESLSLIALSATCDSFARMQSGTCLAGRGAIGLNFAQ
jgi:hypothetical protein